MLNLLKSHKEIYMSSLLTVKEVKDEYKISSSKLYRLFADNKLSHAKLDGKTLVIRKELDNMIKIVNKPNICYVI